PRGQRLALEKQDWAEKPPADTTDSTRGSQRRAAEPRAPVNGAGAQREAGLHRAGTPEPLSSARPADRASEPHRPARMPGPSAADASDKPASPPRVSQPRSLSAIGPQRPSGTELLQPAAGPGPKPAPIARQVADLLAGGAGGGRGVRAASGGETPSTQAVAARVAAGPADAPVTARQRGAGRTVQTRSSETAVPKGDETTRRSGFDHLIKSLRLQVSPHRSMARLRLEPPELGWIRIEARVEGAQLQLFVETETKAAGDLLRTRIADLQAALDQHGVRLDRFEMTPGATPERQEHDQPHGQGNDRDESQSSPDRQPDRHTTDDPGQTAATHAETSLPPDTQGELTEPLTMAAGEMRLDVRA
ncbi:MAG: flagellar hook-length control protein FliK, partial [Planctomycetota bacterium]